MSFKYNFEKLEVWIIAKDLAVEVYRLTEKFPAKEKYGLISQLTRAVISVSSNIAEGNTRKSNKEKVHYIEISYGSLMEVVSILVISKELKFVEESDYDKLRTIIEELSNKLIALKNNHNSNNRVVKL
ncbi:MAG: four helix bundle protein [Bacteroidia bacterium]|nr:four helix bundle protein [Bacteroidia bacterium]